MFLCYQFCLSATVGFRGEAGSVGVIGSGGAGSSGGAGGSWGAGGSGGAIGSVGAIISSQSTIVNCLWISRLLVCFIFKSRDVCILNLCDILFSSCLDGDVALDSSPATGNIAEGILQIFLHK